MDEENHLKILIDEKFLARDKALEIAAAVLDRRLENMNKFREQLLVQAGTFITRVEHEALINAIATTQKYVWMALGGIMVIGSVIQISIFLWSSLSPPHNTVASPPVVVGHR